MKANRQLAEAAVVTAGVGLLVAVQLVAQLVSGASRAMTVVDVACTAVTLLALPALPRLPVPVSLLVSVLSAASPVATPAASYGVFRVASERRFRVAVLVGAVGALAHLVRWWWQPLPGLPFGWWALLVGIATATLIGWGAYTRARRALLEALCERARRAEDQQSARVAEARQAERTRIAREMHDVLAHRLSLLATYAGALEFRPDGSPERLAQAAGVVRAGVHQALDELRDVITVLRADDGDAASGPGSPQPTLLDLPRLVDETRAVGTQVTLDVGCDSADVPNALGRSAYRVVQEGLTNARRHAPGSPVQVRVTGRPGGELVVEVRSSMSSLVPAAAPSSAGAGTGLVGLAERVELLGGGLEAGIASGDGSGVSTGVSEDAFVLRARLPWPA